MTVWKKHRPKKTGAFLRAFMGVAYMVETRAPEPDTPAAMYWELEHFPYGSMQPRAPSEPRLNPYKGRELRPLR